MNIKQKQGFSLIELMVVVAIIGILATVAVPNFMKFQAKAKQTNAKVELSAIFTAEKAFYTEYSTYHSYLPYVGYTPDGCTDAGSCTGTQRYYTSGFTGGINAQINTAGPITNATLRYPSTVTASLNLNNATVTQATFTAKSRGNIGSGSYASDEWTITQNKVLSNP